MSGTTTTDEDWLQERATELAREHENEIYTSRATLLELLVISDRFAFDRIEALSHALEIAQVEEDESVLFRAADFMDRHGLTAFDAYHVAFAAEDPIISSDKRIDRVTAERIPIESENVD